MRRFLPGFILLAVAIALIAALNAHDRRAQSATPTTSPLPSEHPGVYDTIRTALNEYVWPTDAGHIITSCFGEYRRTHFHGGIDISTGDRVGYRVFASRAGSVSRIRIEAEGYGKILYVRHSDGYTTAYAHLDHFAPRIEERARREQLRLEQYPISIECDPTEFPVQQGELIAFTGETGTGSPHLHFEVRDENMNAINPFLCPRLQVVDRIVPEYRKLALIPLSDDATINNLLDPVMPGLRRRGQGKFIVPTNILLTGRVGFAVYIRDRSDGSHYYRGVYRHQLFIDDQLRFEVRIDRAPMREAHQIGLYYVRDLLRIGEGRFEKLFVDTRSTIPFFAPSSVGAGILDASSLTPGNHRFRIASQDFFGHSAEISGTIVAAQRPVVTIAGSGNTLRISASSPVSKLIVDGKGFLDRGWTTVAANISWDSSRTDATLYIPSGAPDVVRVRAASISGPLSAPAVALLRPRAAGSAKVRLEIERAVRGFSVILSTSGVFTSEPSLAAEEGSHRRFIPIIRIDEHRFRGTFVPEDTLQGARHLVFEGSVNNQAERLVETIEVFPIVAGRRGSISLDNGRLQIRYDSLSVYETLYLTARMSDEDGAHVYELAPSRAILRSGLTILAERPEGISNVGLFTRTGGRWTLFGKPADAQSTKVMGHLSRWLDDVAVLVDSTPPSLSNLRFVAGGRRRPKALFRFWDGLSGVDYQEVKTYIDGKFVVPDIDGEHRRATVQANDPLTRGSHQLTIRLQDHLGNASVVERRFVVP